jgi:hypothetical protein
MEVPTGLHPRARVRLPRSPTEGRRASQRLRNLPRVAEWEKRSKIYWNVVPRGQEELPSEPRDTEKVGNLSQRARTAGSADFGLLTKIVAFWEFLGNILEKSCDAFWPICVSFVASVVAAGGVKSEERTAAPSSRTPSPGSRTPWE